MVGGCRTLLRLMILLALGCGPAAAESGPAAASPVGDWQIENGHGVIDIRPCGNALCGRIVGIHLAPGEQMPTDVAGRSQCGLPIITDATPTANGVWVGQITDPRDGSVYQAEIWLDDHGRLNLRGFVLIPLLGKTQVWHRFTGSLTAECRLA